MSKIICARVKALRETNNLSQRQLADEIGVAKSVISMIESGRRSGTRTIEKLATYFNVPEDFLKGYDSYEHNIRDFLLSLDLTKDGKISDSDVPLILENIEQYLKKAKEIVE